MARGFLQGLAQRSVADEQRPGRPPQATEGLEEYPMTLLMGQAADDANQRLPGRESEHFPSGAPFVSGERPRFGQRVGDEVNRSGIDPTSKAPLQGR